MLEYDYRENGYYFVTICTDNREEWFGSIEGDLLELSVAGRIVQDQWNWLGERHSYVELDEFIVMPNHIHGILVIQKNIDVSVRVKSLSSLIGAFKSTSSKLIRQGDSPGFKWQKSFYDHVIRNPESLEKIRTYIRYNPAKWQDDDENTNKIKK